MIADTKNKAGYFVRSLLKWHKNNYRYYPWRTETSAYRIMIAEFMLQRTKADQVVPVYNKFLERYPDIKSLAESELSDIEELLKPLGLYWRASHFKKAANYLLNEHKGVIPASKEELLKVPGVGEYVCGAILAVAYSKSTNIIDSNIARILNRYFGLGLAGEFRRNRKVNDLSEILFSIENPKDFLFAIIDFGALVCTSSNPHHDKCPIKNSCIHYQSTISEK